MDADATASHVRLGSMTVALVTNESAGAIDAIREHTYRLAAALTDAGIDAEVHVRNRNGTWSIGTRAPARRLEDAVRGRNAVVLQYQGFLWGRWGFSPWLPISLWRARRRDSRPRIALFVHERPVQPVSWRWALMGLWQRLELFCLQLSADVVLVTIPAWRASLRRRFAESAPHVPVGSNLPDRRADRQAERERLGIGDETIVLTLFGSPRPDRRLDLAAAAANAVAGEGRGVVLMNLGAQAPALSGLVPEVVVDAPGELAPDALARRLAAGDVFLAPFVDGVSTRRTTVMAALQHALAVVGTDSYLTDPLLRAATDSMRLVPIDREDAFVATVVSLSGDPAERRALGRAAAALYSAQFDWPVAAQRLIQALDLAPARG